MDTMGYKLIQTCGACPEQYDVYKDDNQVGYLRLRHGWFRADAEPCGTTVYQSYPKGDGIFDSQQEREFEITKALVALTQFYKDKEESEE